MPRLLPDSSLLSPAVSIPGSQQRAGPAEHLQPCCQHHHPAGRGGAPREQHLPVPRRLIGQRQLCPSPGVSLVSGSSVPPPLSHWSATALSLPRCLIGQRQLRRLPLAELPCAGAAVGSRQLQARLSLAKRRSRQPGPPRRKARRQPELSGQHRAGSRGTTGASAEDSSAGGVRENGSEGAREREGPCAAPQAHCPPLPRGIPVGWGCGIGIGMRDVGWAVGLGQARVPPAPQRCCQHLNRAPPTTNPSSAAPGAPRPIAAPQNRSEGGPVATGSCGEAIGGYRAAVGGCAGTVKAYGSIRS